MTILQLGIFAILAVIIGQLKRGRELALLGVSVFILYWIQPPQQFVPLTFWLPTASLALTIFVWSVITPAETRNLRLNWPAVAVIACTIILFDLNQFLGFDEIFVTSTPRLWMVATGAVFYLIAIFIVIGFSRRENYLSGGTCLAILLIFAVLKSSYLTTSSLDLISNYRGEIDGAPHQLLSWLGYSYLAFRLLHTIRDHQLGRSTPLILSEYVNYVIFFPSLTAGPIDRADRFVQDLRNPRALADEDWLDGGKRLFVGLFKKFVVADSLALIALSDVLVGQTKTAGWMWFFLYAYSLRIYFDFSGYSDIAIGLARLMRIRLPENFAAPYLKPNLTQFWNSWHMSLTQWFRTYFFNPLTRSLRAQNFPAPFIILIAQIFTMLLIGLWHGVTWGFALWGLWHGLGLFIQNRWSDFTRARVKTPLPAFAQTLLSVAGIFLTFHFVSVGWLFFTLSTPLLAWQAILKLFGVTA